MFTEDILISKVSALYLMHRPRKTSPEETKRGISHSRLYLDLLSVFRPSPKHSGCFFPVQSCRFESPSHMEALHGRCLVSADVWALRWLCVLLSGLPQLERESLTMYNLLEFPLIRSTICSFLSSCKNNENCSITFFPDVAHCVLVLDTSISFGNLWSTAQFALDRAAMLRYIIFLFCFHVKWEIRIGMFKQVRYPDHFILGLSERYILILCCHFFHKPGSGFAQNQWKLFQFPLNL